MTRTEEDVSAVNQMKDYIRAWGNRFDNTQLLPRNFATGEQLEERISNHRIKSVETGEQKYVNFKVNRLQNRSVNLFATILNVKIQTKLESSDRIPDKERNSHFSSYYWHYKDQRIQFWNTASVWDHKHIILSHKRWQTKKVNEVSIMSRIET